MLIQISDAFARLGWGKRVLTYEDFENACEREGVCVIDTPPMPVPGYYSIESGQHFIALERRLRGWQRALVAWHEFAHFVHHVPGCYGLSDKSEMHARAISHIAILPVSLIKSVPVSELIEIYGYPSEAVTERLQIYRAFKR